MCEGVCVLVGEGGRECRFRSSTGVDYFHYNNMHYLNGDMKW